MADVNMSVPRELVLEPCTRPARHCMLVRRKAHSDMYASGCRSLLDVETKADTSPVTVADREAEEAIRVVLKQRCPEHAVLGEESGYDWPGEAGQAEYMWVIDPIDGTKSFITGAFPMRVVGRG